MAKAGAIIETLPLVDEEAGLAGKVAGLVGTVAVLAFGAHCTREYARVAVSWRNHDRQEETPGQEFEAQE